MVIVLQMLSYFFTQQKIYVTFHISTCLWSQKRRRKDVLTKTVCGLEFQTIAQWCGCLRRRSNLWLILGRACLCRCRRQGNRCGSCLNRHNRGRKAVIQREASCQMMTDDRWSIRFSTGNTFRLTQSQISLVTLSKAIQWNCKWQSESNFSEHLRSVFLHKNGIDNFL